MCLSECILFVQEWHDAGRLQPSYPGAAGYSIHLGFDCCRSCTGVRVLQPTGIDWQSEKSLTVCCFKGTDYSLLTTPHETSLLTEWFSSSFAWFRFVLLSLNLWSLCVLHFCHLNQQYVVYSRVRCYTDWVWRYWFDWLGHNLSLCPFQKRILDGSLGFAAGVSCFWIQTHTYTHPVQVGEWCNMKTFGRFWTWQAEFLLEPEKAWQIQMPHSFIELWDKWSPGGELGLIMSKEVLCCNRKYIP